MNTIKDESTILVIGGTGYLGGEICRLLHNLGRPPAFTYFQNEARAGRQVREWPGSLSLHCDLRNKASVENCIDRTLEHFPGLSAVIVAAGAPGDTDHFAVHTVPFSDRLRSINGSDLDLVFSTHCRGVIHLCQSIHEHLRERGGNIVILGSLDGSKPISSPIHFAAGMSALPGLVASLGHELGPDRILINLLAIGLTAGGASTVISRRSRELYLKHSALKRFAGASEVAEVAIWFAMENTYVTGKSIPLDGGL